MSFYWLALILASIGSAGIGFIWLIVRLDNLSMKSVHLSQEDSIVTDDDPAKFSEKKINTQAEDIFSPEFRAELKNKGRLHFENILNSNAAVLQKDLQATTNELNGYMKQAIVDQLKQELVSYDESLVAAKKAAIDTLQKTNDAIDQQRQVMLEQIKQEIQKQKAQIISNFNDNMASVVNHYILNAVGDQIDLSDQMQYILSNLETNRQEIMEDIKSGT